jgi:pilus assembly protein Flp/PilA
MNEFQTPAEPSLMGDSGEAAPSASTHDRGATAVEYAIMVSLIAVVIIAAVTLFGQNMIQLFQVPSSAL